jgi:hypothetical protein
MFTGIASLGSCDVGNGISRTGYLPKADVDD